MLLSISQFVFFVREGQLSAGGGGAFAVVYARQSVQLEISMSSSYINKGLCDYSQFSSK